MALRALALVVVAAFVLVVSLAGALLWLVVVEKVEEAVRLRVVLALVVAVVVWWLALVAVGPEAFWPFARLWAADTLARWLWLSGFSCALSAWL